MEQRLSEREERHDSSLRQKLQNADSAQGVDPLAAREGAAQQILELEELVHLGQIPIHGLRRIRLQVWRWLPLFLIGFVASLIFRFNFADLKAKQLEEEGKKMRRHIIRFRNQLDRFNDSNGSPLAISQFVVRASPMIEIHFRDVFIWSAIRYRRQCLDAIVEIQRQQEKLEELIDSLRKT